MPGPIAKDTFIVVTRRGSIGHVSHYFLFDNRQPAAVDQVEQILVNQLGSLDSEDLRVYASKADMLTDLTSLINTFYDV